MKVVHKNNLTSASIEEARELEKTGDNSGAEKMYKDLIRQHPKNEEAHNRLMILYRRQKEYAKELKAVNEAIKIFEARDINKKWAENKTIHRLSQSIARSTGLVDKKGKHIYLGQPLEKWNKRRDFLRKKVS